MKVGDKVTIEVTWDTGALFGVLKAETEYTIIDAPAPPQTDAPPAGGLPAPSPAK